MARKIQHRRGNEANLPQLSEAEFGFTTDTHKVFIGSNAGNVELVNTKDIPRASQTLKMGTQVLTVPVASPLDVQIEGRTMVSMGNSNLEGDKRYVLTDKKTKVKVDNTTISGVGKFKKNSTLTSKADFVGKVSGSTTENPHISKYGWGSTPINPTGSWGGEHGTSGTLYSRIQALDATVSTASSTGNTIMAQHLFSFNVIEQVERTMGRIPKDTTADKIQWLKDNVNTMTFNWHGFGSSVGGNKATLKRWLGADGWFGGATHSNASVTKISELLTNAEVTTGKAIDTNGFAHFISYADASNGTVASTINTDFAELQIDLKTSAQLDTRPVLIRMANFEGKVSGSTVENPHVGKSSVSSTIQVPTGSFTEFSTSGGYAVTNKLDGSLSTTSGAESGRIAQELFSFDLIAEVERNLGKIPASDTAGKVAWLKANVAKVTCNWHGYGSSPSGNKAMLSPYYPSQWVSSTTVGVGVHTSSTVSKLTRTLLPEHIIQAIQTDGFVHFLAYAEPSDGTTPSRIYTDYVELEIELKAQTDWRNESGMKPNSLQDSRVPLFEVTQTEYDNILVSWTESEVLSRYPMVEGAQSIQGLMVTQEGENLLPPFNEWTVHANAKVLSPYELELTATGTGQNSSITVPVLPNRTYFVSGDKSQNTFDFLCATYINGTRISNYYQLHTGALITTESNATHIMVIAGSGGQTSGTATFKNPMLTLGSTAKPFVPRNTNYLIADLKLRSIGDRKDSLYPESGEWKRVKQVEELVLDGALGWTHSGDYTGFKLFQTSYSGGSSNTEVITKNDGRVLNKASKVGWTIGDVGQITSTLLYVSASDQDTGFGESYAPIVDEIKAYFNGWRAKTVDANGKPTAWHSVMDGADASTQTLAYVSANKAPNYVPYKLFYVRSTPVTEVVTDKVEGALVVVGQTQITMETGAVVREKALVSTYQSVKFINAETTHKLVNRVAKFISIYKNGAKDIKWGYVTQTEAPKITSNGIVYARLPEADFDTTAEYTVTYLVLDREKYSTNPTAVTGLYNQSMKDTFDTLVQKVADQETTDSILVDAVADLYRRMKILGG